MYAAKYLKETISTKNFELIKSSWKKNKKFKTETANFQVVFKNIPTEFIDSIFYMSEIMHHLVRSLVKECKKKDKIKIIINHPVLSERIELPFVFCEDLTSNMIMSKISKIAQSNKILTLDNNITFHTIVQRFFRGGGGILKRLDTFLCKKQSIVRIKSHKENKLCALRAIIVGKAISDEDAHYDRIRDSRNSYQNDRALEIAEMLNLNTNEEIGAIELKRIEDYLIDYQIIVFNNDQMNEIMYVGKLKVKKIFLFYHDNHFDVIKSLPSFYGNSNYCFQCMKPYDTFVNHPCNNVCKKCRVKSCVRSLEMKKCDSCLVTCNSTICYLDHLKNVCNKIKKCEKCGAFNTFKHNCGQSWCKFCKVNVDNDHKCYILKNRKEKQIEFGGYIFFDYECMQVDDNQIPNLIVASRLCNQCLCHSDICDKSECKTFVFKTNEAFGTWLFTTKKKIILEKHIT